MDGPSSAIEKRKPSLACIPALLSARTITPFGGKRRLREPLILPSIRLEKQSLAEWLVGVLLFPRGSGGALHRVPSQRLPDDRAAIVVLTNQDAATASGNIGRRIAPLLFAAQDADTPKKLEQASKIFAGLQKGTIDRTLFTEDASSYFSAAALQDFASSLAPLGTPQEFVQTRHELRGGMVLRVYRLKFPDKTLRAWTFEMPDGKLEQYQIAAVE